MYIREVSDAKTCRPSSEANKVKVFLITQSVQRNRKIAIPNSGEYKNLFWFSWKYV